MWMSCALPALVPSITCQHYHYGIPRFQESCHPSDLNTRGLEDMSNASLKLSAHNVVAASKA